MAQATMEAESAKLEKLGIALKSVGILESSSRKTSRYLSILASHALIHAARGTTTGTHWRRPRSSCGLEVRRLQARALEEHAMKCLRQPLKRLLDTVNGTWPRSWAPWGADQKKAALLAWNAFERQALNA